MADFVLKSGDSWPPMVTTLTEIDGSPIDLTAATVTMRMKSPTLQVMVGPCSIVGAATAGVVSYTFTSLETAVVGDYQLEFDIDYGAGKTRTAPNDGYKELTVMQSLDP